jgi:hypothetical protein
MDPVGAQRPGRGLARCAADLRRAIATAATQVDKDLKNAPAMIGESRELGRRIHIVPPLSIRFRVHEEVRAVSVISVRIFQMH